MHESGSFEGGLEVRHTVVDFVRDWSDKTEIPAERFISWIGIARGNFFGWRKRYGKVNEHNALVPPLHAGPAMG
ncbi:MAG: hypothetical protein ABI779_06450 [Acidobacteriota bacterium]